MIRNIVMFDFVHKCLDVYHVLCYDITLFKGCATQSYVGPDLNLTQINL